MDNDDDDDCNQNSASTADFCNGLRKMVVKRLRVDLVSRRYAYIQYIYMYVLEITYINCLCENNMLNYSRLT